MVSSSNSKKLNYILQVRQSLQMQQYNVIRYIRDSKHAVYRMCVIVFINRKPRADVFAKV